MNEIELGIEIRKLQAEVKSLQKFLGMTTIVHTRSESAFRVLRKANGKRFGERINRLIARDGLRCHWCGRLCNKKLSPCADLYPTVEHVVRRADGGSSAMHNLVLACRQCNNERHQAGWKPNQSTISSGPFPPSEKL